jgi:hypothetical protein
MKEMLQSQFINYKPESQLIIWQTIKSTALVAAKADQTKQPWQELVPVEYHQFSKIFSEKVSQ